MNARPKVAGHSTLLRKLMLMVAGCLVLSGGLSLWVSLPIVRSLANVASDTKQFAALGAGRLRLVELFKLRHSDAEARVAGCAAEFPVTVCVVRWNEQVLPWMRVEGVAPSLVSLSWADERTLQWARPDGVWRLVFHWEPVQSTVQDITDWLSTREHLGLVGEDMTRSFVVAMMGSSVIAMVLSAMLLWLLTRKTRRQYAQMSQYIKSLGKGELKGRPDDLLGGDDISLVAAQVEELSADLARERERAIEADRMATWQTMARKVAHEIKNPLTPIGLVGEQLGLVAGRVKDPQVSVAIAESSRVIAEEIESLNRMVREFAAFARLPKAELLRLDLADVVRDFVTRNQRDDGPVLKFKCELDETPAMMDRGMMHQVLHNLVTNARLAKSPARVDVVMSVTRESEHWCLDVTDDGPGVPEALGDQIFDAYVTTRSTGESEKGMGLGLTISRQIARDHGGQLILYATGSKGTTMRLVLPVV